MADFGIPSRITLYEWKQNLLAGRGVDGEDAIQGCTEVHHAVDDNGGRLKSSVGHPGLKDPGGRELFDVGPVDLGKRAVPPRILIAAVMRPILLRRTALGPGRDDRADD